MFASHSIFLYLGSIFAGIKNLDALYKRSTQVQDINLIELEPPSNLNIDLRPYQKKYLDWLIRRETQKLYANDTEEKESVDKTEPMNPLWREFKWPQQPVA